MRSTLAPVVTTCLFVSFVRISSGRTVREAHESLLYYREGKDLAPEPEDPKDVTDGVRIAQHSLLQRAAFYTSKTLDGGYNGKILGAGPTSEIVLQMGPDQFRGAESTPGLQKGGIVSIVFGLLLFLTAIPIQLFNEKRSVKLESLLARGRADCISVDPETPQPENRGRLVHVHGKTHGSTPLTDPQFEKAVVERCLKLQSTVEVFLWVQTSDAVPQSKEKRTVSRFKSEWTTTYHDSIRFKKPSPENPQPQRGLQLGTFTTACPRIKLGAFVLTDRMTRQLHSFEPAMSRLPDKLTKSGVSLFANTADGYYYARPSRGGSKPDPDLFTNHQVGDMRVRFMCVPEGDATVVAVQCNRDCGETFVPYRPITRSFCRDEAQERLKLIEEGVRGAKERELGCCDGGSVASCCCCACNTIAVCCNGEIVTEEIFYISEQNDPLHKPFDGAVSRNPWRVWNFRLLGWGIMFFGVSLIIGPLADHVRYIAGLRAFGQLSAVIFCGMVSFSVSALIMMVAYWCYLPNMSILWAVVMCLIITVPLIAGRLKLLTAGE